MVAEDYVVMLPESVKDWSDVNDVLVEHAERLMAALGAGWEMEGPLYENQQSCVELHRRLRSDPQKQEEIYLAVAIGVEATGDPLPPDPLPMQIGVVERNEFVPPATKAGQLFSYVQTAAVMAGGAAAGFLVWRALGGSFLPLLAGIVAMIALLIAVLVIKSWIVSHPTQPSTPSPEFLAVLKTVRGQLAPS